jgi:hypothetical protein
MKSIPWIRCVTGLAAGILAAAAPLAQAAVRVIDSSIEVAAMLDGAWTTREGLAIVFAPDAEIESRVGGAFHGHIDPLAEPVMRGADDSASWPYSRKG